MPRERDYLAEICLMLLQERELRGRGATADELTDAIERTLDPRHVEALLNTAQICQARLELRGRRLVTTNHPERRLQ